MMKELEKKITDGGFVGTKFEEAKKTFVVEAADNYQYIDPIDKSVAKNQVRNSSYRDFASSFALTKL